MNFLLTSIAAAPWEGCIPWRGENPFAHMAGACAQWPAVIAVFRILKGCGLFDTQNDPPAIRRGIVSYWPREAGGLFCRRHRGGDRRLAVPLKGYL